MENTVVLREIDLEEPFADLATSGALTPRVMLKSWEAMEGIRLIAAKLPAYQSGGDPQGTLLQGP